ncbi:hypothetical protein MLD38_023266 [Melastoma candidum]|uniref:Uncharacterized protein n=1 Tax=Melastoma candidum TaxID=119954 RepID=A0ACB9QQ12_9MYRT|nr:hypothetical protein MLD38_023266 [Melastoma candidum]
MEEMKRYTRRNQGRSLSLCRQLHNGRKVDMFPGATLLNLSSGSFRQPASINETQGCSLLLQLNPAGSRLVCLCFLLISK